MDMFSEARNILNAGKTKKKRELNFNDFDGMRIGIASPQKIKAWISPAVLPFLLRSSQRATEIMRPRLKRPF